MALKIKLNVRQSKNKDYKLYVYRSKHASNINTIDKLRLLSPILIIDEQIAVTETVNEQKYYLIIDENKTRVGVTYYGPEPNPLPTTEYMTTIATEAYVNQYTHVNTVTLKPTKPQDVIYYYSVMGVNEASGMITHPSMVSGCTYYTDYEDNGMREVHSSNDGITWTLEGTVSHENKDIQIGDINNPFSKFQIPVISAVSIFESKEIKVKLTRDGASNVAVIDIPNIWKNNNKNYCHRKLKSFKVRNVYQSKYGDFSEATTQLVVPIPPERLNIHFKEVTENPVEYDTPIPITEVPYAEIIRRDGIYYNLKKDKTLEFNKCIMKCIDGENRMAYNESSTNAETTFLMPVSPNRIYNLTLYVGDTYKNYSNPVMIKIIT